MNWDDVWDQLQQQNEASREKYYGELPGFEDRKLREGFFTWEYVDDRYLDKKFHLGDFIRVYTFPNNQAGESKYYTGQVFSKHGGEVIFITDGSGTVYNASEISGENISYEKLVPKVNRKRLMQREIGNPTSKRMMNSRSRGNRLNFGKKRLNIQLTLKEINKLIRIISSI